jgi:hypothetical protein
MKKTADILILKHCFPIDGPFEKPPKIQATGSGGPHAAYGHSNYLFGKKFYIMDPQPQTFIYSNPLYQKLDKLAIGFKINPNIFL